MSASGRVQSLKLEIRVAMRHMCSIGRSPVGSVKGDSVANAQQSTDDNVCCVPGPIPLRKCKSVNFSPSYVPVLISIQSEKDCKKSSKKIKSDLL